MKRISNYIEEHSTSLTISKILKRILDDLPGDEDPALSDLPENNAEAISLSRSALFTVQHVSDQHVDALSVDIQLGVWVGKLGYQFKEVCDRIHLYIELGRPGHLKTASIAIALASCPDISRSLQRLSSRHHNTQALFFSFCA